MSDVAPRCPKVFWQMLLAACTLLAGVGRCELASAVPGKAMVLESLAVADLIRMPDAELYASPARHAADVLYCLGPKDPCCGCVFDVSGPSCGPSSRHSVGAVGRFSQYARGRPW